MRSKLAVSNHHVIVIAPMVMNLVRNDHDRKSSITNASNRGGNFTKSVNLRSKISSWNIYTDLNVVPCFACRTNKNRDCWKRWGFSILSRHAWPCDLPENNCGFENDWM